MLKRLPYKTAASTGLIFLDGSERSAKAMKRVRRVVTGKGEQFWRDQIALIRRTLYEDDCRAFFRSIEYIRLEQKVSQEFAFGLVVRHMGALRYQNGNIIDRILEDIVRERTFEGILLPKVSKRRSA